MAIKEDSSPHPSGSRLSSIEPYEQAMMYSHISRIESNKSCICLAVSPLPSESEKDDEGARLQKQKLIHEQRAAQEFILNLYCAPSISYIRTVLTRIAANRDNVPLEDVENAVYEIWSNIITKVMNGKLHKYNRKLSFGIYLKEVLRNEVRSFLRVDSRNRIKYLSFCGDGGENDWSDAIEDEIAESASAAFDNVDREQILEQSFEWLCKEDTQYGLVIRFLREAESNQAGKKSSKEIAAFLAEQLGITVSESSARKQKQRAILLLEHRIATEVGLRYDSRQLDRIEQVATDLNLLPFCSRAIEIMRVSGDVLTEQLKLP